MSTRLNRWSDRADAVLDRLRITGTFRRDLALAVVVALLTLGLLGLVLPMLGREGLAVPPGRLGVLISLIVVQALVLAVRRLRPALGLVIIAGLDLAVTAALPTQVNFDGLAKLVAAYTCGTLVPNRRLIKLLVAVIAAVTIGRVIIALLVLPGTPPAQLPMMIITAALGTALSYAVPAVVGRYVATRRDYLDLVRRDAEQAIRVQQERAVAAVAAERSRIARELHDIAAHHLSGMAVQAAAIERLIDRDPAAARQATGWVRQQSRETLANLRQVVGLLREPSPGLDDDGAPVPGLAAVDRLVEAARALGTPVELQRSGTPVPLPPIGDLACYRVIQEALSNARAHAPGAPVTIRIDQGTERWAVVIMIDNEAVGDHPPAGDDHQGLGLIGMRERAQLIGADLEAGPRPDGGWRVVLRVPPLERRTAKEEA